MTVMASDTVALASIKTVKEASDEAVRLAGEADKAAGRAETAAGNAETAAATANNAANGALDSLSTVQDVLGVLNWAQDNAQFTLTLDTALEPGKTYWTLNATTNKYEPVVNPVVADISTYYEISGVDEAMSEFINTHLALDSEGLWILPAVSGGFRVLIATGQGSTYTTAGMYIVDPNNGRAAQFLSNSVILTKGTNVLTLSSSGLSLEGTDWSGNIDTFMNISGTQSTFMSKYPVTDSGGTVLFYFLESVLDKDGYSLSESRGGVAGKVVDINSQHIIVQSYDADQQYFHGGFAELSSVDGDGLVVGARSRGDTFEHARISNENGSAWFCENASGADVFLGVPFLEGSSSTAGSTTTKVVSCVGYTLNVGNLVAVKFTNANTGNVSLNVNSTGAKMAYYKGSSVSATNGNWAAGETIVFMYDGSYYQRIDAGTSPADTTDEASLMYAINDLGWIADVMAE